MELEALISDDYALQNVRLLYHVGAGVSDGEEEVQYTLFKEFKDIGKRQFHLQQLWDNRLLKLAEGQVLSLRLEARDNAPQQNLTISNDITIPIISEAELRLRLSEELVEMLIPLDKMKNQLNSANRKTKELGE